MSEERLGRQVVCLAAGWMTWKSVEIDEFTHWWSDHLREWQHRPDLVKDLSVQK